MPATLKEELAQPEGHMTAANWKTLKGEGERQGVCLLFFIATLDFY